MRRRSDVALVMFALAALAGVPAPAQQCGTHTVSKMVYIQFTGCSMPDSVEVRIGDESLTAVKKELKKGIFWVAGPLARNAAVGALLHVETPSGLNVRGYCAKGDGFPPNDTDCVLRFIVPCDREVWAVNVRSDPDQSEFKYARKIRAMPCDSESEQKLRRPTPADIKWIGKREEVVVKIYDPGKIFLCDVWLDLARFDREDPVVMERARCGTRSASLTPATNSPQNRDLDRLRRVLPFSKAEFTLVTDPENER